MGFITQSTQNGTGPAVNNPSLNNIQDLSAKGAPESYLVTIVFPGSITAPGNYNLTGSSLTFSDSAAATSEAIFGRIQPHNHRKRRV
jgi:hypothetical protein